MTAEWIRFFLIAAVLIAALIAFTGAVLGAWRFGFVMNRLHAAGIGDTLGVLLVIIAAVISAGLSLESLKLVLIAAFCISSDRSSFLRIRRSAASSGRCRRAAGKTARREQHLLRQTAGKTARREPYWQRRMTQKT